MNCRFKTSLPAVGQVLNNRSTCEFNSTLTEARVLYCVVAVSNTLLQTRTEFVWSEIRYCGIHGYMEQQSIVTFSDVF